jgi:hypothetical protein
MPTLGDIIDGWPENAGDTLEELATVPTDTLKSALADVDTDLANLVWHLRAQAREMLHSNEREGPLGTPAAVASALRAGTLRPKREWWISYPLDARHRRISAPHKSGGSRFVLLLRKKFPTNDDLLDIEAASGYLTIWGGSPEVLSIKGVPERIRSLTATRVVDVMFWDESVRTLHSLRFGLGETTDGKTDFPPAVHHIATELKEALWPCTDPK